MKEIHRKFHGGAVVKIYVIGQSGSGKSWMANQLSENLNLPHIEIDLIWKKAGGLETYGVKNTPMSAQVAHEITKTVKREMRRRSWVIDGNYRMVQPTVVNQADIVILMDLPFRTRFVNVLQRHLSGEDHRRGFTTRNFFIRHLPKFIRKGNKSREKNLRVALTHPHHYIVHSKKEARMLLDEIHRKFHGGRS